MMVAGPIDRETPGVIKIVTLEEGQFPPQGYNLNHLGSGPLDKATCIMQ